MKSTKPRLTNLACLCYNLVLNVQFSVCQISISCHKIILWKILSKICAAKCMVKDKLKHLCGPMRAGFYQMLMIFNVLNNQGGKIYFVSLKLLKRDHILPYPNLFAWNFQISWYKSSIHSIHEGDVIFWSIDNLLEKSVVLCSMRVLLKVWFKADKFSSFWQQQQAVLGEAPLKFGTLKKS